MSKRKNNIPILIAKLEEVYPPFIKGGSNYDSVSDGKTVLLSLIKMKKSYNSHSLDVSKAFYMLV